MACGGGWSLERNFRELDAFYEKVIDEHINKGTKSKEEEDLFDVLLRLHNGPAHQSTHVRQP